MAGVELWFMVRSFIPPWDVLNYLVDCALALVVVKEMGLTFEVLTPEQRA